MEIEQNALERLVAKDEIRELAMLYSRGVDRKDGALLRTLYTSDGVDEHADTYNGGAERYVDFLETAFPHMRYSGHHICNHLISVDGDTGEGEVYALCYHVVPDGSGGWLEDFCAVRYIDSYRKEAGRWRFAKRVLSYDLKYKRPFTPTDEATEPVKDASYSALSSRLFARGARG
jgi:SnoaL-like domain